jgi:16S rRNA (cytosine1402-N4)-methyltransferase
MTDSAHKSVLVQEVITYLNPQPDKIYFDATFGAGGHTRAILEYQPLCHVIACDWDDKSLEIHGHALKEHFGDRLTLIWGNFAHVYRLLKKEGIRHIDGALADFGTSQIQITEREGFSLYRDTPLDMRMSRAHHSITAAHVLNTASQEILQEIFWLYGGELQGRAIARAIVASRKEKPLQTTQQLAHLVERVIPFAKGRRIHPATKVFQALRIYVNKELDNITSFLHGVVPLLTRDSPLVCISFHSLEDRLVKQFFKEQEGKGVLRITTPKVVAPTADEVRTNPSSRSARLRAAVRCGG